MSENSKELLSLSAMVVAAYVQHNRLPQADLSVLIASTHAALTGLGQEPEQPATDKPTPAVSIKKSITADWLICLEDGKKFKSLRRHLRTAFDMSPEEYRAKWGLPVDYPMVAPAYAEARSALAKRSGLGQQRRKTNVPEAVAAAKGGRRKGGRQASNA